MKTMVKESLLESVKPIRDIVYDLLRKGILEGNIEPGEHIVESDYAKLFKTSRTPIREALRKLETEGFVEYIPRKGVIVKGFSLNDIVEIFEIRKSLESLSMEYTVRNITDKEIEVLKQIVESMEIADSNNDFEGLVHICERFHDTLLEISNMPRLRTMINLLQEYLEVFKRNSLAKEGRRKDAIIEHREILSIIIEKDLDKAKEQITRHIEISKRTFLENYRI